MRAHPGLRKRITTESGPAMGQASSSANNMNSMVMDTFQNDENDSEDSDAIEEINLDDDDEDANLLDPGSSKMGLPSSSPESAAAVAVQIMLPFLVAGMGMVAAGLVLDTVQHWKVFETVSKLFILIPALLGLKGNLEMTLASRLSTHANLGNLDDAKGSKSMLLGNLALVQCQAIVVGLLAAVFAIVIGWIPERRFDADHALLLCASSILTASIASFVLALVMMAVIKTSRHFGVNPDNVATPIAASLGDLTTLLLLAAAASALFTDLQRDRWLAPVVIAVYLLVIAPLCAYVARSNKHTEQVLYYGWTPVLLAMMMSSLGGMVLDVAISKFSGIAVYQPVINGVGGNLVAVQASRISTHLHSTATLGKLPPEHNDLPGPVCISPWGVFLSGSSSYLSGHARTARILLAMVVPGHLVFTLAINLFEAGHEKASAGFLALYLAAALLQVWILLHTAHWLTRWLWTRKIDPDNSAIPYLTALGDLLGGVLLWCAFEILYLVGQQKEDGVSAEEARTTTAPFTSAA